VVGRVGAAAMIVPATVETYPDRWITKRSLAGDSQSSGGSLRDSDDRLVVKVLRIDHRSDVHRPCCSPAWRVYRRNWRAGAYRVGGMLAGEGRR
jgi:hypothetical protein